MYFLLFITLICVVYIKTFKQSFNEEQIQKVTPILMLVLLLVLALAILTSILNR